MASFILVICNNSSAFTFVYIILFSSVPLSITLGENIIAKENIVV